MSNLLTCPLCGEVWPANTGRRCRECDRHGEPYDGEDE